MKSKVFLIETKGKVFLVETINETNVKIAPKDYSKVKTNVKSKGSDYSDDGNEKKQDPREVHFGAVDAEVRGEVGRDDFALFSKVHNIHSGSFVCYAN